MWYKVEFEESGKPIITMMHIGKKDMNENHMIGTYKRFTDVSIDNAAGSAYVTFSYRLENETGDKVEGRLRYSNNTDNEDIYLRMHNMGKEEADVVLKRVK